MATFKDLQLDWSMLGQDYDKWTSEDLQLAAELGKTLLERNKELENNLKQYQNVIEDHSQEIEYLSKQNVALREVNESRMRIYEQLEVSIQDLERTNHRLLLDNSTSKKHIKTLKSTNDGLETKSEELQATIDDLTLQLDILKSKCHRPQDPLQNATATTTKEVVTLRHVDTKEMPSINVFSPSKPSDDEFVTPKKTEKPRRKLSEDHLDGFDKDLLDHLQEQMEKLKAHTIEDEKRIRELEENLFSVLDENRSLESQLCQISMRGEEMKSMHEELTTLEEVRQGQMCSRCLRNVEQNHSSLIMEDEDASMLEALTTPVKHRSSFSLDIKVDNHSSPITKKSDNLYKNLADKYEALLEVQRQPLRIQTKPDHCISLHEELQMSGDFNNLSTNKDTDEESGHGDSLQTETHQKHAKKAFSHTPSDFSEAETSSSGFADETSNKSTQTDGRIGSFLYEIADGDDCKLSIYDDATNSRFSKHREVVTEILTALKNASDKAEKLPSVETIKSSIPCKVPIPMLPQVSELIMDDDRESVLSSTMSELSQTEPTTIIENLIQSQSLPIPEADVPEKSLRPLVRAPLEPLEIGKRSSSRRRKKHADRSDSPATQIIGSPKINYSKKPATGRSRRNNNKTLVFEAENTAWNGNTLEYCSRRNLASPTPSQGSGGYFEFRPSPASQDLNKLKQLERSYAEVVRLPNEPPQVPKLRQRRK